MNMQVNPGALIGAVVGGPIAFLLAGKNPERMGEFTVIGVAAGAILGNGIWALVLKFKKHQ